ncbi:MAG: N-acetylglucosamine/diacetylchitobiose ABC transporter substrate-binding protein [Bifidobacteriaceae bacterium]|jgi:N-acetylglucosamine transport system substrate-binding protein|nr:N-acetylglucosamine/diacetylchitobiose ABC transporter substrate-binding protein [Bifidobacteriaceae bacterium]
MHKSTLRITACAAAFGLAAALTACGSDSDGEAQPTGAGNGASADNPFNVEPGSSVDALILAGGYDTPVFVEYAAELAKDRLGLNTTVSITTDRQTDLQTRLAAGEAPDLSSAPDTVLQMADEMSTLDDVWDSVGYDGVKLSEALLPIAKQSGTYAGKFVVMPITINQYTLYYSASLFRDNGWTPPTTWDEMMELGEAAKAKGKYLFTFGKEAAVYWEWMALDCAVKQGGMDVYLNLANLKPGAYSDPNIKACFTEMKKSVDKGYWVPGGAGTQYTQAQATWSNDQDALFYFTGSWIENEMKDLTAEGFEMTAWPAPFLDPATAKLPFDAVQQTGGEILIVWKSAKNVAGGKELLRALLSKDAATYFAKTTLSPSVVKGVVPADGWGSTALASATQLAEKAGDNALPFLMDWANISYGINTLTQWNSFLSGDLSVDELIAQLQKLSDDVANDPSIEKTEYTLP